MRRVRSPIRGVDRRSKDRSRSSDRDHKNYESSSKTSRSKSRDKQNNATTRRESYSSPRKRHSEDLDLNRRRGRRRSRSRSGVCSSRRSQRSLPRGYPDAYYRSHSWRQSFVKCSKSRSRSPSPNSTDSKSWKKETSATSWKASKTTEEKPLTECDLEGKSPDEIAMMKVMGFCNFDSTNGRQVEDNMVGTIFQNVTRRKYRQYMNRKGGFNRPLEFTH